jgi:predicted DNA-binding ribbon-helix-helix protein
MKGTTITRSIVLSKHKTSICLEKEFWKEVNRIARPAAWPCPANSRGSPTPPRNLSSPVRLFAFDHCRAQAPVTSPDRSRLFAMILALTEREARVL